MGGETTGLAAARAAVDAGHELVRLGRYAEARARFAGARGALVAALGEAHVEVRTLDDDLATVAQMAGMWEMGRSMGLDWRTDDEPAPAHVHRPRGPDDER